jgi:hypothetical protein
MRIHGSIIREQGKTFAVVIVKPQVIKNRSRDGGLNAAP